MKVYIIADLEGVSCIVSEVQTIPSVAESMGLFWGRSDFDSARRILTQEVNAAVEGALRGGAAEIVVNDAHGGVVGPSNLILEELHEAAWYVIGKPRRNRLAGLDETVNAVFLIGYHAMSDSPGAVLEHTMSSRTIASVRLNGVEVGEIGIDASIAGELGIPVVLVTGDDKACSEAKSLLGDVETVVVKKGLGRCSALCLAPKKACRLITKAAEMALRRLEEFKPLRFKSPVTLEIEFQRRVYAEARAKAGGLLDGRTIVFRGKSVLDVMKKAGWWGSKRLGLEPVRHQLFKQFNKRYGY